MGLQNIKTLQFFFSVINIINGKIKIFAYNVHAFKDDYD